MHRVGVVSRLDVLSPGERKGLWSLLPSIFQQFGTDYNVLAGGVVSNRDLVRNLKIKNETAFQEWKATPKKDRFQTKNDLFKDVKEDILRGLAMEIAKDFPRFFGKNGESVKTYIVTAPAPNYDSSLGTEIAIMISSLREDIIFWGEEDHRFVIKGMKRNDGTNQQFHLVLPRILAWRGEYYSTRPERLIRDKEKQSAQRPPELWVADCAAISLVLPAGGERQVPIVSFPALHKLQRVTTSENQVGVGIIEFSENSQPKAWFVSLKDLIAQERSFVSTPKGCSRGQKKIIKQLKNQPSTIGMIEDAVGMDRLAIQKEINAYTEARYEPAILLDDSGVKYDFDQEWMRDNLAYPDLNLKKTTEEVIAGFACMHAGYTTTQYRWWVEDVPRLILKHGAKTLVFCGDRIAGLKHNLHLQGAVIAGLNYTQQELLAAHLEGYVIFEVFKERFHEQLKSRNYRLGPKGLSAMIRSSLLYYRHFLGNHDKWLLELGVTPLATAIPEMIRYLAEKINSYLQRIIGFSNFSMIQEIVKEHIVFGRTHVLESGLVMGINHPEMARARTASLRAQQVLTYQRNCHICQYGNFHTAKAVMEWNQELGERIAIENGSIVSETDFESGKMKLLDTAISFIKVYSKNGRIIVRHPFFESPTPDKIMKYNVGELSEILPTIDLSWKFLREFPHI